MDDLVKIHIEDARSDVRKTLDELTEQLHNQHIALGAMDFMELMYQKGITPDDLGFVHYFDYLVDYREMVDSWAGEDLLAREKETEWGRVKRNSAGGAMMGLYFGGPLGAVAGASLFALATYVEERTTRIKTDMRPTLAGAVVGAGIDLLLGTPMIVSATCAGIGAATEEAMARKYMNQEHTRLLLYGETLEEQRAQAADRLKKKYEFKIYQALNKVKIMVVKEP
ncbi:MAG: hypothetical protein ACE5FT_01055 [Candidatus Nanoarchaeia archaeon]